MRCPPRNARRGTIIPLLAFTVIILFAFVALAVDLGLMAVARTQCQNAADAAAMAGARTLNGDISSSNNFSQAVPNALAAAAANQVLAKQVKTGTLSTVNPSITSYTAGQVTIVVGKYYYDSASTKFVSYPLDAGSTNSSGYNWTLVDATVNVTEKRDFSRVFGLNPWAMSATARAVHRPRDVALLLDYTGSMRYSSLLGAPPFSTQVSNNPEAIFPQFGAYSAVATAALQATTPALAAYDLCNITDSDSYNFNRPPMVGDFYQQDFGAATTVQAFTAAPAGYATAPGGDRPLKQQNDSGANYGMTVSDILTSTNNPEPLFEDPKTGGYDWSAFSRTQKFKGYTQGPSYWGMTFFTWPPDPRPSWDWRKLYFFKSDGATPVDDNTILWNKKTGVWQTPETAGYKVNYLALLKWIQTNCVQATPGDGKPFPAQMRSGRILYYSALPDTTDATLNTRFWTQVPLTDLNERFWKDYIDYVLGIRQYVDGHLKGHWISIVANSGYGLDYSWSNATYPIKISGKPANGAYMDYADNPPRPRTHFWFGPMTMVDFLGNYTMAMWGDAKPGERNCCLPGTCHEAPLYACKYGIQAALQDIQNNHPNDMVSLIMFSQPKIAPADLYGGRFNRPRVPLGMNYQRMLDSLWFPAYTIDNPGTEIRPYDYDNVMETPHGFGITSYSYAFMLAYNQFSGNATALSAFNPSPAPVGDAGGLGRKGAQKLIILETDGAPNTTASATLNTSGGAYNCYYPIRYNSTDPTLSEYPSNLGLYDDNDPAVTSEIDTICNQICALDSASVPGYSTTRKPVLIHCLAFGPLFDTNNDPNAAVSLATLQEIQYIGKTQASATTPLPAYKIINGDDASIITNLRSAISTIMQDGIQISLIR